MPRGTKRSTLFTAALAALLIVTAGCSGPAGAKTSRRSPHSTGSAHATNVTVLYAGSLVHLLEKQIGPRFDKSTRYTFEGYGAGSQALATQIKGKVHRADVFISADPDVNESLTGKKNGNWVSWYATFAKSPLAIGYNPKSDFADDLESKPWYRVITEPGFRIGRTDPETDPKGQLAAHALTRTAKSKHLPELAAIADDDSSVLPEESMIGRLQAGQLDAGFLYASEAKAAGIPTVPLTGVDLGASYTVTRLNDAPHPKAAAAFIKFLLGAEGRKVLKTDDFELPSPPHVTGQAPGSLRPVLSAASSGSSTPATTTSTGATGP